MIGTRGDAHLRGWLSGVAALVAHGLVLLGMPDAAETRAQPSTPLWLTIADEQPAVNAAVLGAASSATEGVGRDAPTRRRRIAHVVRAHTSAIANVPEAVQTQSPALAAPAAGVLASPEEGAGGRGSISDDEAGAGGGGEGGGVATRPALLATRNPCLGYFPARAHVDQGRVQIQVRVDETGRAHASEVMAEAPVGHDFGLAARACAAALRFVPARDALGIAVAADAKLELYFHRS